MKGVHCAFNVHCYWVPLEVLQRLVHEETKREKRHEIQRMPKANILEVHMSEYTSK